MLQKLSTEKVIKNTEHDVSAEEVFECSVDAVNTEKDEDTDRILHAYETLMAEAENLPQETCLFVTDMFSDVIYGRYTARMKQNGFLSLPLAIDESLEKPFICNRNMLKSEIYTARVSKRDYIAVEYLLSGAVKCSVVTSSEDHCFDIEEYRKKLAVVKEYLGAFAKRCYIDASKHNVLCEIDSRINGCNELVDCGKADVGRLAELSVDMDYFAQKVCELVSGEKVNVSYEKSGKDLKDVWFTCLSEIAIKNILYTVGFLANNSRDKMLKIHLRSTDRFIRMEILCALANDKNFNVYYDTLVRNMKNCQLKSHLKRTDDDNMSFRAVFPLVKAKDITVGEVHMSRTAVSDILSSREVKDALFVV